MYVVMTIGELILYADWEDMSGSRLANDLGWIFPQDVDSECDNDLICVPEDDARQLNILAERDEKWIRRATRSKSYFSDVPIAATRTLRVNATDVDDQQPSAKHSQKRTSSCSVVLKSSMQGASDE